MKNEKIIETNRNYWNEHADLWYGTTALPEYGVRFPTEDELHLFGDVRGKKLLEMWSRKQEKPKYFRFHFALRQEKSDYSFRRMLHGCSAIFRGIYFL